MESNLCQKCGWKKKVENCDFCSSCKRALKEKANSKLSKDAEREIREKRQDARIQENALNREKKKLEALESIEADLIDLGNTREVVQSKLKKRLSSDEDNIDDSTVTPSKKSRSPSPSPSPSHSPSRSNSPVPTAELSPIEFITFTVDDFEAKFLKRFPLKADPIIDIPEDPELTEEQRFEIRRERLKLQKLALYMKRLENLLAAGKIPLIDIDDSFGAMGIKDQPLTPQQMTDQDLD